MQKLSFCDEQYERGLCHILFEYHALFCRLTIFAIAHTKKCAFYMFYSFGAKFTFRKGA